MIPEGEAIVTCKLCKSCQLMGDLPYKCQDLPIPVVSGCQHGPSGRAAGFVWSFGMATLCRNGCRGAQIDEAAEQHDQADPDEGSDTGGSAKLLGVNQQHFQRGNCEQPGAGFVYELDAPRQAGDYRGQGDDRPEG